MTWPVGHGAERRRPLRNRCLAPGDDVDFRSTLTRNAAHAIPRRAAPRNVTQCCTAQGQCTDHCLSVFDCASCMCARVSQQATGGASPGSPRQDQNPSHPTGSSPSVDRARKRPRVTALRVNEAQPLKKTTGSPSADPTTVAQVESVRPSAPATTAFLSSSSPDRGDDTRLLLADAGAVPAEGGQIRLSGARPARPRTLRKSEQLRQGLPNHAPREQRHGGPWTIEEEAYMNRIIHYFNAGLLESAVSLDSCFVRRSRSRGSYAHSPTLRRLRLNSVTLPSRISCTIFRRE